MRAEPAQRLSLAVQYAVHDPGLPSRPQVRRWVSACKAGTVRVTVRFVDAEEGRGLNARYRGKDYATNVLSFPYAPPPALEGDLVVCADVVRREAQEQGKAPEAHFAHLIVHGMLHLEGFDHENEADAARMEVREQQIMARLGFPDPYGEN
jgi:probable rRNA maturation factor